MTEKSTHLRLTVMLPMDALLAVVAIYAALALQLGSAQLLEQWRSERTLQIVAIFVVTSLFSSYLMDAYTLTGRCSRKEIFTYSLQAAAASFFFLSVIYYLDLGTILGHGVLFSSIALFLVLQFLWHVLWVSVMQKAHFCDRVLILGTGTLARQLGEMISQGDSGFSLVGYLESEPCSGTSNREPTELLVTMEQDLITTVRKARAGVLVVALSERRGTLPLQEMMQCKLSGIDVVDAPTFYEIVHKKLLLEEITPSWIIFSSGFRRTPLIDICKRCIDIILSLVGLLLSAPFFPLIALAVKLDSPGPLFFKQIRVGSGDKSFVLYKFRSMRQDAERDGAVWAAKNDARVTAVGRILRNTRIDEIPQLYNVLKGEMSFIGPRPERPEFVEMLKKDIYYYSKRHTIKPGLTGWAQVRYPYGATVQDAIEKLRYDLYYIKNLSFSLDAQIIFETIKVVLFGRGGR